MMCCVVCLYLSYFNIIYLYFNKILVVPAVMGWKHGQSQEQHHLRDRNE